MPLGLNQLQGGGRRCSASESDGDVMSSTLNQADPVKIDYQVSTTIDASLLHIFRRPSNNYLNPMYPLR